jgi:hypothetical protein
MVPAVLHSSCRANPILPSARFHKPGRIELHDSRRLVQNSLRHCGDAKR